MATLYNGPYDARSVSKIAAECAGAALLRQNGVHQPGSLIDSRAEIAGYLPRDPSVRGDPAAG